MAPLPAEKFSLSSLYNVSGLVALVTGGGTGIGLMIAQGFAANGAKVYITGRREDVLEKQSGVYGTSGGQIITLPMDVTDKESILKGRARVEEADGRLDVLVNNAGQSGPKSPFIHSRTHYLDGDSFGNALFESESFEGWSGNLSANVTSIYFISTAFLGLLEKGAKARGVSSSIINITSVSGMVKLAQDHFCYNVGKAAAGHMTKILATELALRRIPVRVNAIAPGVYESEMTTLEPVTDQKATDAIGKPIVPIPAERSGSEEEIAATALLLASSSGGYINGQELVVDGGYLTVNPATR